MKIRLKNVKINEIGRLKSILLGRCICFNRMMVEVNRFYSSLSNDEENNYYFDLKTAEMDCQELSKGIENYEYHRKELNEISDYKFLFDQCYCKLLKRYGEDKMKFGSEIVWLLHAPGTVNGRIIKEICNERGLYPISLRSIIKYDKNINEIRKSGKLFQNSDLLYGLLNSLIKFQNGCLVFGIPRNIIQAQFVKLLYDKMVELNEKDKSKYELPRWKYIIIHSDEEVSINKQLNRGKMIKNHNKIVKETGSGILIKELESDNDIKLAYGRYYIYKKEVLEGIKRFKKYFNFEIVDGNVDSEDKLLEKIVKELEYQSSLELNSECLNIINEFPICKNVIINGRKNLIKRLEYYNSNHLNLFLKVIEIIKTEFEKEIIKHSENGLIIIRSENILFSTPLSIEILKDILSERGYEVLCIIKNKYKPCCVEIDNHGNAIFKEVEYKEYVFEVSCLRNELRS